MPTAHTAHAALHLRVCAVCPAVRAHWLLHQSCHQQIQPWNITGDRGQASGNTCWHGFQRGPQAILPVHTTGGCFMLELLMVKSQQGSCG